MLSWTEGHKKVNCVGVVVTEKLPRPPPPRGSQGVDFREAKMGIFSISFLFHFKGAIVTKAPMATPLDPADYKYNMNSIKLFKNLIIIKKFQNKPE